MATPLIAVESVAHSVPQGGLTRQVLHDATFDVSPGELVALTGPPGTGKSTLLHVVAGLLRPAAGAVRLDDEDVWRASKARRAELRRGLLALVPAAGGLVADRSLAEQIEQPLRAARLGRRDRRARVEELIDLAGLGTEAHRYPDEVGEGARWRAAVARALTLRPRIVLIDEPPAHAAEDLLRLLAPVTARQGAVLVATDDAAVAALAGRALELVDGEVRGVSAESRVRLVEPPEQQAGGGTA